MSQRVETAYVALGQGTLVLSWTGRVCAMRLLDSAGGWGWEPEK